MNTPTTNTAAPYIEPLTRAAAQILAAALAAREPTGDEVADTTVTRHDFRVAWYKRYPEHDRKSGPRKRVGSDRMKTALRALEQLLVVERTPDTVRVVDVDKLKEISESADNQQDREKRRHQ